MRATTILVAPLALPCLVEPGALADAARKEQERRAKTGARTVPRVLTEQDLASSKGELATVMAGQAPSSGKIRAAGTREAAPAPEKTEAYWRQRVTAARLQLEDAEQRYAAIDRMIRLGQPGWTDSSGRSVMYSQQQMKTMADEAQRAVAQARQALEQVLEEGRRAGALPGWLREFR